MTPFEAGSRELTWSGPDPSCRVYVLQAGNEEIGGLRFKDESGSVATGKLDSGEWIFEHSGALHPRVRIRLKGSVEPLGNCPCDGLGAA